MKPIAWVFFFLMIVSAGIGNLTNNDAWLWGVLAFLVLAGLSDN